MKVAMRCPYVWQFIGVYPAPIGVNYVLVQQWEHDLGSATE